MAAAAADSSVEDEGVTAAAGARAGPPTAPVDEVRKVVAKPTAGLAKRLLCRMDVLGVVLTIALTILSIALLSGHDFETVDGVAVPFWKVAVVLAQTVGMIMLMTFDIPTYPSEIVLIGGAAIFGLLDIIPSGTVLGGLSDSTVTSVALLFTMARAISDTGALEVFVGSFLGTPKSTRSAVFRLCILVGPLSALVNNTPVTAMMVPVLDNWCARVGIDVAKLAMPLAFCAQLGGGLTLMGADANFAARKTYLEQGYNFGFFELTLVAAPLYVMGIIFFVAFAPILLGKSQPSVSSIPDLARQHSTENVCGHFLVAFRIIAGGAFSRGIIKVGDAGFGRLEGVVGIKVVIRDGQVVWGREVPGSEEVRLKAGDAVIFRATAEGIVALRKTGGLSLSTEPESNMLGRGRKRRRVFEVELPAASGLLNGPVDCAALRTEHGCALLAVRGRLSGEEVKAARVKQPAQQQGVVAVIDGAAPAPDSHTARASRNVRWTLSSSSASLDTSTELVPEAQDAVGPHESLVPQTTTLKSFDGFMLQEGDVLLLEANPHEVGSPPWARDFGILRAIGNSAPPKLGRTRDTIRTVAAMSGSALAIVLFVLSSQVKGMDKFALTTNLLVLVLFLLTTRTMTVDTVYESLNGPVLLTMVGAFPLGAAIQAVGLDFWAGRTLMSLFAPLGKIGPYIAIYLVSSLLSNMISNIAVIAMVVPVSVQMAQMQDLNLHSIVVCTTLATAAVYTFPIGHQTNLMVVPLGKYGWGDFFKMGGAFQVVHGIACCLLCMSLG